MAHFMEHAFHLPRRPLKRCSESVMDNFAAALGSHLEQKGTKEKLAAKFLRRNNCAPYITYNFPEKRLDIFIVYTLELRHRITQDILPFDGILDSDEGYNLLNTMHELDRPVLATDLVLDYADDNDDPEDIALLKLQKWERMGLEKETIRRILREAHSCRKHLGAIHHDISNGLLGTREYSLPTNDVIS